MATGGSETDRLSDETFDLLCTMCKQEGRNREADKYCTDCSDYYCTKCVKVHDTVPVLKGHKIVDKEQFTTPGSSKTLPMVPTERCDNHGLKPVDMYCQKHDEVGCATCMAVEHRLCKDIFYIPEFIEKNKYVSNSRDMERQLESTEKVLTENIRNFEKEKQTVLKRKVGSVADIQKFRKEINSKIDAMEKKSITEIEEKFKAMISKMDEEIKDLQKMKASVKSARDNLEAAGNNSPQVFVGIKMGQAVVQKAKHNEIKSEKQNKDISFKANQKLMEMLEEVNSLGEITQSYSQNDTLLQIKEVQKYSIKIQSDSSDCFMASCCVLDGSVILADYSNRKLKRLNRSTFSVEDHYDLPGDPWQVCAINNQEVAVSYRHQEIMFISLGQKMKQKCTVKTDFQCYGLAYASGNLYISDKNTSVYIYSVAGRQLKRFNKDQAGQDLFSSGYYIEGLAVNKDGSKIYVSDWVKGVVILDNNGQLVRNVSCQELQAATGVHVAANGTVLVCGYTSNNVLQFGPDGRLMGEVLKVNKCRTVCCSQDMSKLIVGREWSNVIGVYDLV